MTKIVGLDLSLTSTGVALIIGNQIHVDRLQSKGRKDACLTDRSIRLRQLVTDISSWCTTADLIIIEGPSFGQQRQGGQHDRAGLWWLTVARLTGLGYHVAEISPASRSKYATGKGNAAKDAVLAAVIRRYPTVDVTGNDEADALILAAMGARHLGQPIDDLPKVNLDAMTAVRWPELAAA